MIIIVNDWKAVYPCMLLLHGKMIGSIAGIWRSSFSARDELAGDNLMLTWYVLVILQVFLG